MFRSSLGIDIDVHSIDNARENAKLNNLPNTGFAAADATLLFQKVPYPPDQTLIVIDPPRKGCSKDFLRQLLEYGPRRIAYVSCNVHTQARDVGYLVQNDSPNGVRYDIESIRGFDFFPQTGHVEGLAILNKVQRPVDADADVAAPSAESKTEDAAAAVSVEKEV
jgi:tRNA (uracil-5-)-methyltransferase